MFISFEGVDGCGKTTQVKMLEQSLKSLGFNTLCLREPGGTPISEEIRQLLLTGNHSVNIATELLLFEAARSELVHKVIKPALEQNIFVLCDRFSDSTLAYQGWGRGLSFELISSLNLFACGDVHADMTFFLDAPLEVCFSRIDKKNKDRIENSDFNFYSRVVDGFRKLTELFPEMVELVTEHAPNEVTIPPPTPFPDVLLEMVELVTVKLPILSIPPPPPRPALFEMIELTT